MNIKIRNIVLGIIKKNESFLLCKDHHGDKNWAFPGGGVKTNEKLKDALIREINEETNLVINITEKLGNSSIQRNNEKILITWFLCTPLNNNLKPGDDVSTLKYFPQNQVLKKIGDNRIKNLPKKALDIFLIS